MALKHPRRRRVVDSNRLAFFRAVMKAGRERPQQVTADGPAHREAAGLKRMNTLLRNVGRALDGTTVRGTRIYGPRRLKGFSNRFSRLFQLADLLPRLVRVAVQTNPLPNCPSALAGSPTIFTTAITVKFQMGSKMAKKGLDNLK